MKTLNSILAFASGAVAGWAAGGVFLYLYDERYLFIKKLPLWITLAVVIIPGIIGVILESLEGRVPIVGFFKGSISRKALLLTGLLLAPAMLFFINLGIQADLYNKYKLSAEKTAYDISAGLRSGSKIITVPNFSDADYAVIAAAYSLRAEDLILAGFPCCTLARKMEVINSTGDGRYIYLIKGCRLIGRNALKADLQISDEKGSAFVATKVSGQITVYTRKNSEGRAVIYKINQ